MPSNLSESQLINMWRYQLMAGTKLVTEEGEPIEIIYPGRENDGRGADFRDAVIATNQGLIKGDIEIHVKSSGWWEHGHYRDRIYNRVVLHVVMWHDVNASTSLQDGREVPVLALHKYIKTPTSYHLDSVKSSAVLNVPCFRAARRLPIDTVLRTLDRAGEKRFLAKVAGFQADLTQMEAGQSLYQGIMGALGYSKNKLPFIELARRLPLEMLESVLQSQLSDEECLGWQQALLLGTAGLLPSQCQFRQLRNVSSDGWINKLEGLWSSYDIIEAMSPDAWHLFKVRPSNSPVRRLVAMSYLMIRYRRRGILKGLVDKIKITPIDRGYHGLERALVVTGNIREGNNRGPGSGRGMRGTTLLGGERAADIILNVLLPFASAWGRFTFRPELGRKAFELYHQYSKLARNSLEKHMMGQLGLSKNLVNSAQRQQGLIHIYNNLCTQGKCGDCWLGQPKAGNHVQI